MRISRLARFLALVPISLIVGFIGCDRKCEPLTFISGRVSDSLSGDAINSAIVYANDTTANSKSVATDTLGRYHLDVGEQGELVIFCLAPGYSSKWVTIESSCDQIVFRDVDFKLVREAQ